MASNRTSIRPVRWPNDLLRDVDAEVARSVEYRRGEPWNFNAYAVAAVREKLAHAGRCRGRGGRPRRPRVADLERTIRELRAEIE